MGGVHRMYRGWVPNTRGRVSYSRFGICERPFRAVSGNTGDGNIRYIICFQKRKLLDKQHPIKYQYSEFKERSGQFWFVCIASTTDTPLDHQNTLNGHVYIFPSKLAWRQHVKPLAASVAIGFQNSSTSQRLTRNMRNCRIYK